MVVINEDVAGGDVTMNQSLRVECDQCSADLAEKSHDLLRGEWKNGEEENDGEGRRSGWELREREDQRNWRERGMSVRGRRG